MCFDGLVKRVSPKLKQITRKLNGHFSFMDDQDLYQEALLHLWVDYERGSVADKTDSYLLQGCYFHLKNYIRKMQDNAPLLSMSSIIDEDGARLEEILLTNDPAPLDYAEGRLQIEALEKGMSEREKRVLTLCLEGLTTREIGKQLGISHVSVVKIRNKLKGRYIELNGAAPRAGYQN
jgi:RNA polymerase sigma factor (sigma-70 family)